MCNKKQKFENLKKIVLTGMPKETFAIKARGHEVFEEMSKGKPFDTDRAAPMYKIFSDDILYEKQRIGGNFVIAHAVPTRKMRDILKEQLGNEAIFITLTISEEAQRKRVEIRHKDQNQEQVQAYIDFLKGMYSSYEPAQSDEKNAFDIVVSPEMSPHDVAKKILELVN